MLRFEPNLFGGNVLCREAWQVEGPVLVGVDEPSHRLALGVCVMLDGCQRGAGSDEPLVCPIINLVRVVLCMAMGNNFAMTAMGRH